MNTQEKYLAGYVMECLTGIKGENQDWVYQVVENGDFLMSDPFLQLVYDMAKSDPKNPKVKDAVAGLVIGYVLLNNKFVHDAMSSTITELVDKKLAERDNGKYKDVQMLFDVTDNKFFATVWHKDTLVGFIDKPASKKDEIVGAFKERFPSAKVTQV